MESGWQFSFALLWSRASSGPCRTESELRPLFTKMFRSIPTNLRALTWTPEFNVALFAYLLNSPWEFLQVPLFERMPLTSHWDGVKACTAAAVGDAAISLATFWLVSLLVGSRGWIRAPTLKSVVGYAACGLFITVVIERLALAGMWMHGWSYSAQMPVMPGLGVGLSPLLQWVVLPPLVIWLVRRQLCYVVR